MKAEDCAAAIGDFGDERGQRRKNGGERRRGWRRAGSVCEEGPASAALGGRAGKDRRRARRGSGLSPLRGPRAVAWGRSHGLSRFRCKACGRTFNALTKTAMAHLHKKEKWLEHARDDRAKTWRRPRRCAASIRRRPSAGGIGFCAPCKRQAPRLRGIVEADETFILRSFKGALVDLPRKARRGGTARHPGLYRDNIPILVARDQTAPPSMPILPQVDGASVSLALAELSRRAIISSAMAGDRFRRRPGFPSPVPALEARHRSLIYTSTTSTPTTAVSNNGSTASTASPPRTCPIISVEAALSKPGATNSNRQAGSKALSETDLTADNAIRARLFLAIIRNRG